MQYGGNWGASGSAELCPGSDTSADGQDYVGTAYVNEQPWDISALQACRPGSTCPVSPTFTDPRHMVPAGCQSVQTAITKNSVRGQITVQEPTAGNGWRGELRAHSHCRFRKRGTDYVRENGIKWMSGSTKRQCE